MTQYGIRKPFVILCLMFASVPAFAAVPKSINAFAEGERMIYARLVEAYRANRLAEVVKQRQLLEKNYPSSIHLDNAYYLTGMLEFQDNRVGEAVRSFNTVTDRYPQSNKRPAALFGMAMSYKKLGLDSLSAKVMRSLVAQYPGSPESQRAWVHLELEKKKSKTLKR